MRHLRSAFLRGTDSCKAVEPAGLCSGYPERGLRNRTAVAGVWLRKNAIELGFIPRRSRHFKLAQIRGEQIAALPILVRGELVLFGLKTELWTSE